MDHQATAAGQLQPLRIQLGRMVEGNVGDKDTDVTTYRHQCRHLPTPVSPPTDTSVRLTLESNTRTKAGNSTLPGGKSEQPSSDSKTGDQHPITDIAQVDPSIIAQAATSDIGNSITPPTDIDQAFADFWQHYPPTNHSKPAHVVRSLFLAAVKAGI